MRKERREVGVYERVSEKEEEKQGEKNGGERVRERKRKGEAADWGKKKWK